MHSHINILLVEDNPGDAFLIQQMLRASDFSSATLLTASTLKEALKYSATDIEIRLILLDLGLPDSDGMESVRTIRKHFPDTALNVLTGLDDKQTATNALREGVQNYLVKGEIDSDELEEAIRYSLERHNFINKLKGANESLTLSEQKYKLLFKDNPMPMWVIDYKNNLAFIDVNEAALQHYGYTREEFLSMTSIDIRPEAEKGRYIRLRRAAQQGSNYAGIWRHIKKDGTIIDVEIKTHDIIIDNQEARLVLANDVTEKLKAEDALRLAETNYRELFDKANDAIYVHEMETGRVLQVNHRATELTGFSKEELLNTDPHEFMSGHPDYTFEHAINYIQKAAMGEPQLFEWLGKKKDGTLSWYEVNLKRAAIAGEEKILAFFHEINERKKAEDKIIKSEEQYKDLVENITDLICTHDLNGRILSANKAAEKIVGLSFGPENNWNIKDILSPDRRAAFDEYIATIKEKGHAEGLMKVQTSKGEIRIWEYLNTLKTDGVKAPIIRGYARDITERKKAEEKIRESHKELRELTAHLQTIREEERTHIAREVHDVLGQQITGLKMDMTWLKKKITDKDKSTEKRFTEMLSLADEMVKTIRKIASELRPGILDDLGLIPALEWQSNEFEKRTGIKCLFTSNNTLPDIAQTNATGIFRIYQETLTNVARHAKATKVDAAVTFDGGAIKLSIADNGKGLNTEEMKSKKTLGIVGMKERAAMMKGNLTVQTRTEGGTVVTLLVPVNKTEA